MLFSIIVPVYNIEKYIDKCVASVLSQSYMDWELILVDDGAKDNCPQICDDWTKKDQRIKVVHKQNGGLSSARNAGMRVAQGEWILFLDGDDKLKENALSVLEQSISEDVDMIIGRFERFDDDGNVDLEEFNISSFQDGTAMNQYGQLLATTANECYWSAWHWIYRRKLLIENEMFFREGILAEDFDWTPSVIIKARKAAIVSQVFYCYRVAREGSIMAQRSRKLIGDVYSITEKWLSVFEKEDYDKMFVEHFYTHMLMGIYGYLPDLAKSKDENDYLLMNRAVEMSKANIKVHNTRIKIIKWMLPLFGAKVTSMILYYVRKTGSLLRGNL